MVINNPLTFRYVDDPNGGYGRLVNIQTMKDDIIYGVNETSTTFGRVTNITEHKEISNYYLVNENQQRLYLKNIQVFVQGQGFLNLNESLVGSMVLGKKSGRIQYTRLNDITLVTDSITGYEITVENNGVFLLSADAPLDHAMILVREQ